MTHTLFISYSHSDNKEHRWVQKLTTFLDGLKDELPVDYWDDSRIGVGDKWREEIQNAISQASAAVLLVGPSFLASQFIKENELPDLLRAKVSGTLRLYPMVVAYSPWELSILEPHQAFNDPNTPLESMKISEQNMWLNKLVVTIANDMRNMNIMPAKRISLVNDCRHAIAEIKAHLEATRSAFEVQSNRRNSLVKAMRERLKITEILEYERFFFRYYEKMNDEERFEFVQIRAVTVGLLHIHNRSILDIIDKNQCARDELPILAALRLHLIIWLNKYDQVFTKSEKMSVLYVGVEDEVPFPMGVDQAIAEWLKIRT